MEYILQHPSQGNVNRIELQKDNGSYFVRVYFTKETWDLQKFEEDEANALAKLFDLTAVQAVRYFIASKVFTPKKSYKFLTIDAEDPDTIRKEWVALESAATKFDTEEEAEAVLKTLRLLDVLSSTDYSYCRVYSTDDYLD